VTRRHLLISCFALAGALSGCDTQRPTSETFTWKGPVATDTWLRLRNVSGDFSFVQGTGDSAEIQLVIERSSAYAPAAQVKVLQINDGIVACVLYGNDNTCSATEYRGGGSSVQHVLPFLRGSTNVTGRVVLPKSVKLDAESTNGNLSVQAIASEVMLQTVNGDVNVDGTRGAVKIGTTNGNITIGVDGMGNRLSLETTNGDVQVDLPADINAALAIRTVNGELNVSVPITITTKTSKQIIASLGTGGSPIDISTTNGGITLRPRGAR
jgi:hypothetical protein